MSPSLGVIYVVQAESGGPIKIGYCSTTAGVRSRLSSLQTGNPRKLHVVHIEDGNTEVERGLHREFKHYRLCGEWFSAHHTIVDRFPGVIYEHEDVDELTRMYDVGFENGWERGFDDAAECDECGTRECECPDTPASRLRERRIQKCLEVQWLEARYGSKRRLGESVSA